MNFLALSTEALGPSAHEQIRVTGIRKISVLS